MNGIRKNNVGQWVGIRNGKPVVWATGPGAKAKAIQAAGTNRILSEAELRPRAAAA